MNILLRIESNEVVLFQILPPPPNIKTKRCLAQKSFSPVESEVEIKVEPGISYADYLKSKRPLKRKHKSKKPYMDPEKQIPFDFWEKPNVDDIDLARLYLSSDESEDDNFWDNLQSFS